MASHGEAIQIYLVRNLQVVLLMFLGVKGLKINKRDNPSKHQIQRQTPLIDFLFYVLQSREKKTRKTENVRTEVLDFADLQLRFLSRL